MIIQLKSIRKEMKVKTRLEHTEPQPLRKTVIIINHKAL